LLLRARRKGYRTHKEGKHLRRYETIFITHPELTEEDLSVLHEKLRSIMSSLKGELIKLEDWGPKKLSYEIRKNTRGHYFLLDYLAATDLVRELERNLRLNDRVLKFQTVKISNQVSPEAAQALQEAGPDKKAINVIERSSPSPEPKREEAEPEAFGEEKKNESAS
jgi:small subunit ribosomal protein S6